MVDPQPFLDWLGDRRVRDVLALTWGITPGAVDKRLWRWRNEAKLIPRAQVEDAIEAVDADAIYADVYGDEPERLTANGKRWPSHTGIPFTIPEDVLLEAHRLHLDENVSLRRLAQLFWPRTASASPRSLANQLHNAFRQRGWETLSRREQVARHNRAMRAHLPRCRHTFARGSKAGRQCPRRTTRSSGYCWRHEPDTMAARLERLHAA